MGRDGNRGLMGYDGTQGAQGPRGSGTGEAGVKGAQGPAGDQMYFCNVVNVPFSYSSDSSSYNIWTGNTHMTTAGVEILKMLLCYDGNDSSNSSSYLNKLATGIINMKYDLINMCANSPYAFERSDNAIKAAKFYMTYLAYRHGYYTSQVKSNYWY